MIYRICEGLPDLMQDITSNGASSKTKGVLEGAKESLFGSTDDEDSDSDNDKEESGGSRRPTGPLLLRAETA